MTPDPRDETPTRLEVFAGLFAGGAFAAGAFVVRTATVMPAGVYDGAAVAIAGVGASLAVHRAWGRVPAVLMRAASVAVGALLAAGSFVPPFDRAALPLAAWILGAAGLQASTRARGWAPVLAGAGVGLLALGTAVGWIAAASWPETTRLRLAMAVAAALAAIGLVLRLVVARRARSIVPSPGGILAFAALAATYAIYRPLVATRVANLPLYEWTLGAAVAALLLGRLRRSARDSSVPEAWSGLAERHRQDPTPAYDPRMTPIAAAIQRYLDTGEGFEDYRASLLRGAPWAPAAYRKALQGARPVQGRGRARKAAQRERLATHDALMELLQHGHPEPRVRAHP